MIMDLVKYMESISPSKYYPNAIPINAEDEVGLVRLSPSYRTFKGGVGAAELQIIIRALHPEPAERLATGLINELDKKTGFNIGETRVILSEVKNPFPLYIGKDENDRYKYSVDISLLIEK